MRRKISAQIVQDRSAFAIAKLRRTLWRDVRGCDEVKTPLVSACVQSVHIVSVIRSGWPTFRRMNREKSIFLDVRIYARAAVSRIFLETPAFIKPGTKM